MSWLLLLPSILGLAQRYAETEAEVFNALLSKIQDSTALRDYIYESLLTMKARTCLEPGLYDSSKRLLVVERLPCPVPVAFVHSFSCCTVPGPDFSCVHLRCYLLQIAFETAVGAIDIRTAIRPPLLPPMANPEFKTMSVSRNGWVVCSHVA